MNELILLLLASAVLCGCGFASLWLGRAPRKKGGELGEIVMSALMSPLAPAHLSTSAGAVMLAALCFVLAGIAFFFAAAIIAKNMGWHFIWF